MKNPEIIKLLESSNSRIFKENILLEEMKKNNDIFFEGLNFAYNRLLTFGVKKVPISENNGLGLLWEEFKVAAKQLINREVTGHNARDKILSLMQKSFKDEWNYFFRRILIKDMRCGLSEKTINNVAKKHNFPNFIVPVFSCQLSQDCELHKKKLTGKKILQAKLDGVRALSILYPNGNVDIFSRNGKELNNFENIKEQIKLSLKENPINSGLVLDGEIVSKNFQELMKQIHRKNNVQNKDAKLYLFDIISFENFKIGLENITQEKRLVFLKQFYEKNLINKSNIKLLDQKIVDLDTQNGMHEFEKFNINSVHSGFEGIMIKNPNSPYECKRSTSWLKSKPFIEVSLEVVNYEEGTGRNSGKLGAIIAEGNDNGKFFKLNIGSGFTDNQRFEFWKNRENLIGKIIEVRADSISKSQDGENWSLRFPRFKTFRGFDSKEKL